MPSSKRIVVSLRDRPITSLNHRNVITKTKTGRILCFPKKEVKAFQKMVADTWKKSGLEPIKQGGVYVFFSVHTRKKMDLDNMWKVTGDSLNKIAYDDDSQIKSMFIERIDDDGEESMTISLYESTQYYEFLRDVISTGQNGAPSGS